MGWLSVVNEMTEDALEILEVVDRVEMVKEAVRLGGWEGHPRLCFEFNGVKVAVEGSQEAFFENAFEMLENNLKAALEWKENEIRAIANLARGEKELDAEEPPGEDNES